MHLTVTWISFVPVELGFHLETAQIHTGNQLGCSTCRLWKVVVLFLQQGSKMDNAPPILCAEVWDNYSPVSLNNWTWCVYNVSHYSPHIRKKKEKQARRHNTCCTYVYLQHYLVLNVVIQSCVISEKCILSAPWIGLFDPKAPSSMTHHEISSFNHLGDKVCKLNCTYPGLPQENNCPTPVRTEWSEHYLLKVIVVRTVQNTFDEGREGPKPQYDQ